MLSFAVFFADEAAVGMSRVEASDAAALQSARSAPLPSSRAMAGRVGARVTSNQLYGAYAAGVHRQRLP